MPKGIDKTRVHQVLKAGPFLWGKSMRSDVRLGTSEIEGGVPLQGRWRS